MACLQKDILREQFGEHFLLRIIILLLINSLDGTLHKENKFENWN